MANLMYYIVFIACLTLCKVHVEGKASFQAREHLTDNSDGTLYFRVKGNDAFKVEESHDDANPATGNGQPVLSKPGEDGSDFVGVPNKNILNVPWWPYFLTRVIQTFYRQRQNNRSQFGVLYMGNVDNLNQFQTTFDPHQQDGSPVINNQNAISPPNSADFGNYICSRPENVQNTMIHAEDRMLREIDSLWNAYNNRYHRTPNMIVLYSWIMPCPDCTHLITNHFNRQPYASVPYRVVGYTVEGTNSLPYMTPTGNSQSRQLLESNNITVYRQRCNRPGYFGYNDRSDDERIQLTAPQKEEDVDLDPDTHTCKLQDTFQGCMVECITPEICCSCKESGKKSMVVALVNHLTKECATSDITTCAGQYVNAAIETNKKPGASSCTRPEVVSSNVQQCVIKCTDRPLSKPLDPKRPSFYPGYLTDFSDLSNLPHVDLTDFCEDIRAEGLLCTAYRSDSFTAGDTLCRSGSRCGYHNYKYSWCYVDFSNHWDYCCTDKCSFAQNTNYMWCHSGNKWQYCGDAGENDIKDRRCVAEYPCGMHQENGKASYYWCYTDLNKNWDHCCQPWHRCGKNGQKYNWCYTGYKKKTDWKYCTP